MKLEMVRGCIFDSLNVDRVEEIDMSIEQKKSVLDVLVKTIKPESLNSFLQWYIREYGDYDCDDIPCECCGDYVETWTVEV